MPIQIKQARMYVNFAIADDEYYEPYDHRLIRCECGRLCECGVGMCDVCIDDMVAQMEQDLENTVV